MKSQTFKAIVFTVGCTIGGIFNAASAQNYPYGQQTPQQVAFYQPNNGYDNNNRVRAYPNQVPNRAPEQQKVVMYQQPNPNQPKAGQFNSSVQIASAPKASFDRDFIDCSEMASAKARGMSDAMREGFFDGCMMNLGYNTNNLF